MRHVPPKRRFSQDLRGTTSQKTTFFIRSRFFCGTRLCCGGRLQACSGLQWPAVVEPEGGTPASACYMAAVRHRFCCARHKRWTACRSPWLLVRKRTIPTGDRRWSAKLLLTFVPRGASQRISPAVNLTFLSSSSSVILTRLSGSRFRPIFVNMMRIVT
jgi:hypothetical protein